MSRRILAFMFLLTLSGWTASRGFTVQSLMNVPSAHPRPSQAPGAVLAAPERPSARVVVFFHGWSTCAREVMESTPARCFDRDATRDGYALGEQHDAAHSSARLIVPQLAWRTRDSSAGAFARRGFFAQWWSEIARTATPASLPDLDHAELSLYAHSAGYETVLKVLDDPQARTRVRHVVLLDALYAGADRFAAWLEEAPGRRLVVLHTNQTRTTRESDRLAQILTRHGVRVARDPSDLNGAIQNTSAVISRTNVAHGRLPHRYFGQIEGALDTMPAR